MNIILFSHEFFYLYMLKDFAIYIKFIKLNLLMLWFPIIVDLDPCPSVVPMLLNSYGNER
jgi:hypothetical protein